MENNIFYLIDGKYDSFSKTNKLIASYVKQNYKIISFLSINELKEKTGVSTASITRFAQELGFNGYPDFQREVQKLLQKEITPMKEMKNFITSSRENENILKLTIDLNIKTLEATYNDELYESFKKAVDIINNAEKIYILGLRSSFSVGYYLSFMLRQFMSNIELLTAGTDDIYDRLSYVKKNDILITISFSKYTKLTSRITNYFKQKGNKIIAVTDSYSSPVAILGDTTLIAKSSSTTYSFVSAMTILNALIVAIGKQNTENTMKILKEKERILSDNDIYI